MNENAHRVADLLRQARRLARSGNSQESAETYRRIIALQPNDATAYFELGVLAVDQARYPDALRQLRKAVELNDGQPAFHNSLGIAYRCSGDMAAGERCFRRALELDPENAVAYQNLGTHFWVQGRLDDAVDCYRKALSARPDYADVYFNLGEVYRQRGNLKAAVATYRAALRAGLSATDIRFKLAVALYQTGGEAEAASLFESVAATDPRYPGVYTNLGLALARIGRLDEAVASYRKAIDADPASAAAHNNLGNALRDQNEVASAVASYRNALAIKPDHAQAHSNLLLALNYLPDQTPDELYRAALQFDAQQARGLAAIRSSSAGYERDKPRLRIGYVSPDFRAHSVAHFTRRLIGAHDRHHVEVFCYANVNNPDQLTNEIRQQGDGWVSITGMNDRQVAERIAADRIDILIDLAGHTAGNRLLVFARRPAPVQVTWLGYPNTTGMGAMDYRLTDSIADPPGPADGLYTENLVRLPHGFLCYQCDDAIPAVTAPPSVVSDQVTFGSFNSLPKMNAGVVRIWSRLLESVPDSRLVLKSKALMHEGTRLRCLDEFRRRGISAERLELRGLVPGRPNHLAMYADIDVALDPFPYNGTTTTCEALWMGVPVVTLRGDRHAGRVGASILHHAGVPELVADDVESYADLARTLAADRDRLAKLRNTLRPTLRASELMNTQQFARSLEAAFRNMWRARCRVGGQ